MAAEIVEKPPFGAAAVINLLSGIFVLCSGLINHHPFTEGLFAFTLLVGLISVIGAVLCVIGICRRRVRATALIFAVTGLMAAFLGISISGAVFESLYMDTSFLDIHERKDELTQLASALREYEKANGHLPPAAVYGEHGEALLSWRVLVLPYMGQDDLFKRFKLDEPWNSPNNLPLLDKMPPVFASHKGVDTVVPFTTIYQVFVGPGTAFEGPEGVCLADFPDGLDKTFLVVEAREAVQWTKPADLTYDPAGPLPKLGDAHGFTVCLADCSERYVAAGTSEATLRAAITRNGGDKLGPDW